MPQKTLIQFLIDLADNKHEHKHMREKWKKKKGGRPREWEDLVKAELSGDDVTLMLDPDENRDAIEAKVNADKKQGDIVWTAATVWQ